VAVHATPEALALFKVFAHAEVGQCASDRK
jgi:hypothetical protein